MGFFEFLQHENLKNMVILSIFSICGGLTHYFFWFQIIFVCLYYVASKRHISRYAFGILLTVVIVLAPLASLMFLVKEGNFANYLQVSWSGTFFNVPNFIARLAVALTYGYSTFHLPNLDPARNFTFQMLRDNWVLTSLVLISFIGITYAWVRLALLRTKWFWFFFLGILTPLLIGLIGEALGFYLIREKHLAVVWGSYFVLLLLALRYLSSTKTGLFVIACYGVVVMVSMVHYVVYPNEYSRRMDWTGLNLALEGKINHSDSVLFYASDPQILSLGKMKVLEKNVRTVNIVGDKPEKMFFAEFVKLIDTSTGGTIFLINNETERHTVDPKSELIRTLMSRRTTSERRFGRNLVLYEFKRDLHKLDQFHDNGKPKF